MRISDWSSDVCSSDLAEPDRAFHGDLAGAQREPIVVDHQQQPVALHRRARRGKIERHDGDVFARDILPDVEFGPVADRKDADALPLRFPGVVRSEEHTSELKSLMRNSYAVYCLKKKKKL